MTKKYLLAALFVLIFFIVKGQILSPTDSLNFKADFEKLLKKYKIKSDGYSLNVQSINQRGGQTAFIINNNYYGDTTNYANNFESSVLTEDGVQYLVIYPKKGSWQTPFVFTDSSNAKTITENPHRDGYMDVYDHGEIKISIGMKRVVMGGFVSQVPCSRQTPLIITLSKQKKNEYFLFGDYTSPQNSYIYSKGKITHVKIP